MKLNIKKPLLIKVSQLIPAPWNPKVPDSLNMTDFTRSIQANGFLYGLVIAQRLEEPDNPKYEVLDGNHRLMALRQLGVPEIPAYDMGRLSKADRMKLGIEVDTWKAQVDYEALGQCLSDITLDYDMEQLDLTMPFSPEDMDSFMNMAFKDNPIITDSDEQDLPGTSDTSNSSPVPEIILSFATHSEFNEFKRIFRQSSGERVLWGKMIAAIKAFYGLKSEAEASLWHDDCNVTNSPF